MWKQLNYCTYTCHIQPTKWVCKTRETGNDFKVCNFKKGIEIESEKVCKQVRDQILWKQLEDTAQGLL